MLEIKDLKRIVDRLKCDAHVDDEVAPGELDAPSLTEETAEGAEGQLRFRVLQRMALKNNGPHGRIAYSNPDRIGPCFKPCHFIKLLRSVSLESNVANVWISLTLSMHPLSLRECVQAPTVSLTGIGCLSRSPPRSCPPLEATRPSCCRSRRRRPRHHRG